MHFVKILYRPLLSLNVYFSFFIRSDDSHAIKFHKPDYKLSPLLNSLPGWVVHPTTKTLHRLFMTD